MADIKLLKNPLSIAFGLILRKARERRTWSYDEVEKLSGIAPAYFRAVEQGAFNLHASKAPTLYKLFKNDALDELPYSLEGLMQLLSIISIMETRANEGVKSAEKAVGNTLSIEEQNVAYAKGLSDIAEELSVGSEKLRYLFQKLFQADIFKLQSTDEVTKTIREFGIDIEIENFLTNYRVYGLLPEEKLGNYYKAFFGDIPSIYTDFINETKANLQRLPVRMFFSDLHKWEERRLKHFKNLYVLIADNFDVTHEKNLVSYHYKYLWESNFEGLYFIIVGGTLNEEEFRVKFSKNLRNGYESSPTLKVAENWDEVIKKKVHVKIVPSMDEDMQSVVTVGADNGQSIEYDVFWVFESTDQSLVAFVGDAHPDYRKRKDRDEYYSMEEGRSLVISEIIEPLSILRKIWNKS